jgi:hypothetical protein
MKEQSASCEGGQAVTAWRPHALARGQSGVEHSALSLAYQELAGLTRLVTFSPASSLSVTFCDL